MTWIDLTWPWLGQAALSGFIVLALGSLATALCRQPVRRVRLVEFTLLGSLLVPWLGMLPAIPRWSLGLLPAHDQSEPVGRNAIPVESNPIAVSGTIPSAGESIDPSGPPESTGLLDASPERSRANTPLYNTIFCLNIFIIIHVVGSSGLACWWILGQVALWRIVREGRPARESVRVRFEAISGPAGRRVRLLESTRIGSPFTFTWSRPVILIPTAVCDGDEEGLNYSLAHEWAHVERHDAWSWNLATLAGTVFFYQPMFWWLRRELRLCQDYLADDRAAATGSAEDYAAYLVRLAQTRPIRMALPALGITDRRSNLYRRVVMLVQDHQPLDRRCRMHWSLAVAASAVGVLIVTAGLRLDAAPPDDAKNQSQPPASNPADETLHYEGHVKNRLTGQGIEGATVTVRRSLPARNGGDRIVQETRHTTGAGGQYAFTIPPEQVAEPRLYLELDVEHPDFAPNSGIGYSLALIRKEAKQGIRPFFETMMLRPAKSVTGRVVTPDGVPAAGVEVRAYSLSGPQKPGPVEHGSFVKAATDQDGRFRVPITTPGLGLLWLSPKGYAAEVHSVGPDKRGDLGTLVLRKGITVTGQATDTQGKPLAGLIVEAVHQPDQSPESQLTADLGVSDQLRRQAETDAEGRFTLEPLPPGDYRIQPVAADQPLPGVFAPRLMTLKQGETPGPLEIRAAPHVVIEGRWLDSKGNPRSGWQFIALGRVGDQPWHTPVRPDADGRFSVRVPKGLEHSQISFIESEHAALRHRLGQNGKLSPNPVLMLGTLDHDIDNLEIIEYVAPTVTIKVVGRDGQPLTAPILTGEYTEQNDSYGISWVAENGRNSDIRFEKLKDGRYRTRSLTPDRAVKITIDAKGFKPESRSFKLAEGKTEEVTIVLAPAGQEPPPGSTDRPDPR